MRTSALTLLVLMAVVASVLAQGANPLFKDTKIKNYLPHMTWREAEQALTHTDMVVIPVGSNEQHGPHMVLGTDIFAALETCKLLAQRTDILIAPVVLAGVSEHHMGFPGTITLSPETLEAVITDTTRSLIRHGFKKLLILNSHGGNVPALRAAVEKINQTTAATAVLLDDLKLPEPAAKPAPSAKPDALDIDWHAGIGETSLMLYLTPSFVDMSRAEQPALTLPEIVRKAEAGLKADPNLGLVEDANLFRPLAANKKASSREMSSNGVFTTGDLRTATAKRGKDEVEAFLQAAVKFIEGWKAMSR
jgi:creatinine amidohydrolase